MLVDRVQGNDETHSKLLQVVRKSLCCMMAGSGECCCMGRVVREGPAAEGERENKIATGCVRLLDGNGLYSVTVWVVPNSLWPAHQ